MEGGGEGDLDLDSSCSTRGLLGSGRSLPYLIYSVDHYVLLLFVGPVPPEGPVSNLGVGDFASSGGWGLCHGI